MAKFWRYEYQKATIPKGKDFKGVDAEGIRISESVRKPLTFSEALAFDKKLEKDLADLEVTFPNIQKKFGELDIQAVAMGKEVVAHSIANSPRLAEKRKELEEIAARRDGPMRSYEIRHQELVQEREQLSYPLISETLERWYSWRLALPQKIETVELEERKQPFSSSDFRVRSNRAAVHEGMDFLIKKEFKLRGMRLTGLQVILNFIEQTEKEYSKIDFERLEEETLNERGFQDMKEGVRESQVSFINPETVLHSGPGTPFIRVNQKENKRR
jgi:hypothetical protein